MSKSSHLGQDLEDFKISGSAESEQYIRVEFHLEIKAQQTTYIHLADCGMSTAIKGIKEDLSKTFNIPVEQQVWTLRSRVLEDNKTLADYGLTGTESTSASRNGIQIYVTRS